MSYHRDCGRRPVTAHFQGRPTEQVQHSRSDARISSALIGYLDLSRFPGLAYHTFDVPVEIERQPLVLSVVVCEDNNGDWFYTFARIRAQKKEDRISKKVVRQSPQSAPSRGSSKGIIDPTGPEGKQNLPAASTVCEHKSWRGLSGFSLGLPVGLPEVGVVEAGQGHDGLGVVGVPAHARAFEAGGERTAARFGGPRTAVVAGLAERGIVGHADAFAHVIP